MQTMEHMHSCAGFVCRFRIADPAASRISRLNAVPSLSPNGLATSHLRSVRLEIESIAELPPEQRDPLRWRHLLAVEQ
jgi:hypothetical protein